MSDHKYDDMLHLPHHVSKTRRRMSMQDRAAQFAPFAALTGHGAAIQETARLTDERIELTESSKDALNEKLRAIQAVIDQRPEVTITYFEPDLRKDGGTYITHTGRVKRIDRLDRAIILCDGTAIPLREIVAIAGDTSPNVDQGHILHI